METKVCVTCQSEYPLTLEYFYISKNGRYPSKSCRLCTNRIAREKRLSGDRSKVIYFVLNTSRSLIKIGSTHDMAMRIVSLRTEHKPDKLYLMGLRQGSVAEEYALHRVFDAHRVIGEWFHDCADIRDYIRTHCTAPSTNTINAIKNLQKGL